MKLFFMKYDCHMLVGGASFSIDTIASSTNDVISLNLRTNLET